MASLFSRVEILWGGKDYVFSPTFVQIEELESIHDIYTLERGFAQGKFPLSHMVRVVWFFLSRNGYANSVDDFYFEAKSSEENLAVLGAAVRNILDSFDPKIEEDSSVKKNQDKK